MQNPNSEYDLTLDNKNFNRALELFDNGDWYLAHDILEELWHETYGQETYYHDTYDHETIGA